MAICDLRLKDYIFSATHLTCCLIELLLYQVIDGVFRLVDFHSVCHNDIVVAIPVVFLPGELGNGSAGTGMGMKSAFEQSY